MAINDQRAAVAHGQPVALSQADFATIPHGAKHPIGKHPIATARRFCLDYRTMKDAPLLPPCESNSAPVQSQAEPPLRILVVEDDSSIRQLSTEVLIHFGYHVDAAEDGAAA
jgi:hypothetical protein